MKTAYAYAPLVKHERNADGDLVVTGRATGPDLDLDQQVCDPAWLKTAMPQWFTSGANVREQHGPTAAGVGEEIIETGDGGWDLKSVVIDPVSAKKVEKRVLKGYSIGVRNPQVIKDAAAPGGRIVGGQIVEISLVDRPANPTCTLMLAKAATPGMTVLPDQLDAQRMLVKVEEYHEHPDTVLKIEAGGDTVEKRQFTADQRGQAADKGQAMSDGSFPIKNVADLKNAIQAIGRAKNPAAAKAHIEARAKALGKENLIPDTWKSANGDLAKAAPDGMWVHDPAELAQIRAGLVSVMKAELDELDGGECELGDVSQLLRSLSLFMAWWDGESWHGETPSPYTGDDTSGDLMAIDMSAAADATKSTDAAPSTGPADAPSTGPADAEKAAGTEGEKPAEKAADTAQDAPTEPAQPDVAAMVKDAVQAAVAPILEALTPKSAAPEQPADDVADKAAESEKAPDLAELVKAAVAEATAPIREQVAKAMAAPAPGGPVLTRTAQDTNKAAAREQTLTKAAEFERLAFEVTDPIARSGYLAKAEELRKAV